MSLVSRKEAPISGSISEKAVAAGIKIQTTSVVGFPRTELPNTDNDYTYERQRAKTKMTPEGLKPLTKEETHEEHQMTKALLKKFTQNVVQGSGTSMSFPVAYSEPRSYLERTSDLFAFLVETYIKKSIECTDPVEKLVQITTGILAGYHLDLNTKKVFNPYLGETYMSRWENGSTIYAEQVCHHPPLSVFQIYAPDDSWYCYSDPVKFNVDNNMMSSLDVSMDGDFHLHIKNGPVYEWEFPVVFLSGQVKGDRIVRIKGDISVKDVTNDLTAKIEVSPKSSKKKGITDSRASTIYGGIVKGGKEKKHKLSIGKNDEPYIKTFTGDYVHQILVDGKVVWDIDQDFAHRAVGQVDDSDLLPSDVRYRGDRDLLISNNNAEADKAKTALENLQRREAKIRESVKKKK